MAIPNLFPEFKEKNNYREQRQYVARRLIEMAEAGTLFLTDCLAQQEPIRTRVKEVILGHDRAPNGDFREGIRIPPPLASYTVCIRSIPHMKQFDTEKPDGTTDSIWKEVTDQPITYQLAGEVIDESMTYEAAKEIGDAFSDVEHFRQTWVETDKPEVMLPLHDAVWCLNKQGKNVVRARSRRLQRLWWKVEEVRPDPPAAPDADDEPKRRGPGRPRKEAASAG